MAKQRNTILILGEGPTEFYYLKSLSDVFKGLTIRPDYPKHTNLKELDAKIKEGISLGYRYVFCVVDMDNKGKEPVRTQYAAIKRKYATTVNRPKLGIYCDVMFFETHLCTELFFLYYFQYTSRQYDDQPALLRDLNRFCDYQKTEDFFRKCRGLHTYFEKHGGTIETAINNANHSIEERTETRRCYTYSELGKMLEQLKEIE